MPALLILLVNQPAELQIPQIDLVGYVVAGIQYVFEHYPVFFPWLNRILVVLVTISIPLCVILIIGIIASVERLKAIRAREKAILNAKVEPAYSSAKADPASSERFRHVLALADSENANDWRQAIIEADILLGVLLDKQGYKGEGIGEKLKRVEKSDFVTIDEAWEAHKLRNIIAHEGSNYPLNKRETKHAIQKYKHVFEEFYFV